MRTTSQIIILGFLIAGCRTNVDRPIEPIPKYREMHRPQIHFTPPSMWMNDPNGMVYIDGVYHLFYQHYPDSTVWGPMHWGHAISRNMIEWEHLPIALFPDEHGMIFSGSAVFDESNSSGLGTIDNPPLVAIFTYHDMGGEKAGRNDYQTQGLAYSLDKGKTWTKYKNNPVLKNPGIRDFRDPKVIWHNESKSWVMILAVSDHVEFYGSPNLLDWKKLSEFGKDYGSHGGVWECPDLFQLPVPGESSSKWVMLLSINPGGPNGGSATQYFIGDFDGKNFKSETPKTDTLWVDYGPDNYAGVTWSNIPKSDGRRIFLGWMSNWAYANVVPTSPWRSAMTVPRTLSLEKIGNRYYVASRPVEELRKLIDSTTVVPASPEPVNDATIYAPGLAWIEGEVEAKDFTIELSNDNAENLKIAFDKSGNVFTIDRSGSGAVDFSPTFANLSTAPRISTSDTLRISVIVDVSSIEVFFDGGLTNMTALFFPEKPVNKIRIAAGHAIKTYEITVNHLKRAWVVDNFDKK
jgi:fructan beta-fructosidase